MNFSKSKSGYVFLGVLFIVAIFFVGCTKEQIKLDIIKLTFSEGFPRYYDPVNNETLYFSISGRTNKIHNCFATIQSGVKIKRNTININLGGDVEEFEFANSDACPMAFGPASFGEKIEISEGEYIIKINLEPRTDIYNLSITKEKISISEVKTSFSSFAQKEYIRIPANIISAECRHYEYGCEEDKTNEFCPIFFGEVGKIATPISVSSMKKYNASGQIKCEDHEVKSGACSNYEYSGEIINLINLIQASTKYNLKNGYTSQCNNKNNEIYNWHIDTTRGSIHYKKL